MPSRRRLIPYFGTVAYTALRIGQAVAVAALAWWAGGRAVAQPAPPPPAGTIPAQLSLIVTGTPQADPLRLDRAIHAALDRAIRPTLQPGAAITYGTEVPWPLFPLPEGQRAAVDVTVAIGGDASSTPVSGVTTIVLENEPVRAAAPVVLDLDDDPEYLQGEGLVARDTIAADRPARFYYYHSDIGPPRDLDVLLTAAAPARVQLIGAAAGPDLDVMSVGHIVSRDALENEATNQGIVADVAPGRPFVLRHVLLLQGEVAAGAVDVHVLDGAVTVAVIASPAGGRAESYLAGPRLAPDGHNRHGRFDLRGYGALAATYAAGGPDVAVQYGGRTPTPANLDPADRGRDYGDYGVVHRITFTLNNPTAAPATIYLYEKPLGGPVGSTFEVDGQWHELPCVRVARPYWVATYQLPPNGSGASTTVTMPDGGSFYPLEYGVTATPPAAPAAVAGTSEACSL